MTIFAKKIWIPFLEAKIKISKFIDRRSKKIDLAVGETGDAIITKAYPNVSNKTTIPQVTFNELADKMKDALVSKIQLSINCYINQNCKQPPNKVRDKFLKWLLQEFNKKQLKKLGYKLVFDDNLVLKYEELKNEQYYIYKANVKLSIDTQNESS